MIVNNCMVSYIVSFIVKLRKCNYMYCYYYMYYGCLGGATVRRRTRDRKVAGSTPGRGTIKSTRSTQPSIPRG